MISAGNAKMQAAERTASDLELESGAKLYRLTGCAFGGHAVDETVATRVHFGVSRESVWNHIMFYEDVPGRPPFPLGALLPHPVRTDGDKASVGAEVRCTYSGGRGLAKRIVNAEPAHLLRFEVTEQRLGIECCLVTLGGSYQIHACGEAADVVLTTNYRTCLHPRWMWRPVEALLVRQLHRHILRGIAAVVLESRAPQAASRDRSRRSGCLREV